jgi:hypothetical protein
VRAFGVQQLRHAASGASALALPCARSLFTTGIEIAMRTMILILAGLLIAVGAVFRLPPAHRRKGAAAFTVIWLIAVIWNLRTGLSHGYALQEEAPIQLLIFVVPVAVAWWLARAPRRR